MPRLILLLILEITLANSEILYFADLKVQLANQKSLKFLHSGVYTANSEKLFVSEKLLYIKNRCQNATCSNGCTEYLADPDRSRPYIALVDGDQCDFDDKIRIAIAHNATALIIRDTYPTLKTKSSSMSFQMHSNIKNIINNVSFK